MLVSMISVIYKYTDEMTLDDMVCVPSFVTIVSGIQVVLRSLPR
jgi:hypothetical protein